MAMVGGRFEILELVAQGGMGTVFQARDTTTGALVALKVGRHADDVAYARFNREARMLAELAHPGIVRLVAHGRLVDGEPYLAMEWIAGEDLRHRLARERLDVEPAVGVVIRIADALAALHARGVVHRDVKPANVLLPDRDLEQAKLGDLGIARSDDATHFTASGGLVGTPAYMAPEQCRGEAEVGPRADVFALGCVLFECLTGAPAFEGASLHAVIAKVLFGEAPRLGERLRGAPAELEALLEEMLSPTPAGRPADAAAVAARLRALTGALGGARAVPTLTRSERRLVSVLLAVPAQPSPTAAAVEAELRAAAPRFGAKATVLADGSVVAVLSGTGEATDLCARAARLALVLRAQQAGVPIAVATGRAVTEDRPGGGVIDAAAALLGGGPGIRLDEVTAGLLDARFEVVGGELRGERTEAAPRQLLGRVTPFVGRETELSLLEATFAQCAGESVGRAVLVTAAAGVGKTRLAYELCDRLRRDVDDLEIWIGRGDAVSAGSPFGLLGRALRASMDILDGEPVEARREKLRQGVARVIAEPGPERERVTLFLGELLGTPFSAEGDLPLRAARRDPVLLGDQMRRAWLDFVAGACRARPVVLVLEDLHWGDGPTVKYVDAARRELADGPFFVLALARPEVRAAFPALWPMDHELRLDNLKRRASERLVREVLGAAAAPETVDRLVRLAGGNAFYLEELTRHVAGGGAGELPGTVLAMAQARLQALPEEARLVLRAASIFGQVFWAEALVALARALDLPSCLAGLVEQAVLVEHRQTRLSGTTEYAFRHALLQEAASAMLTDDDRRLGHRVAAEWLEAAGEPDAQVIAGHHEQGDEPARAGIWYLRAAEQALAGDDLDAAIARSQRGIACGAAGELLGRLYLLQATAHQWQGREFAVGRDVADRARAVLRPESAAGLDAARELIVLEGRLGHSDEVAALAVSVAATRPDPGAEPARIAALARAMWMLAIAGLEAPAAVIASLAAVDDRLGADHPVEIGLLADARAIHAACAGDLEQQLQHHRVAATHFLRAGDRRHVCWTDANIGWASLEIGQLEEGERILAASQAQAERLGLEMTVADCRQNLGLALLRLGRPAAAVTVLGAAIATYGKNRGSRGEAVARAYLALAHDALGDATAAEAEAERSLLLSRTMPAVLAYGQAALARARRARGDARAALEPARAAMAVVEASAGLPEGEALIRLTLAEALDAAGDREAARATIQSARAALLARAARIGDAALRRSFLERVPENRRTLARAEEWA